MEGLENSHRNEKSANDFFNVKTIIIYLQKKHYLENNIYTFNKYTGHK